MAEWIPPKTNWQTVDVPGAGDFNRIEGNTAYLKTQTDGLKNGSITAGKATNATNATYATSATNAANATNATKAGDAVRFGGQLPLYYLHAYPITLFAGLPTTTISRDWQPAGGVFQWLSQYTLGGRLVRLKANLWRVGSQASGGAKLRLYDYTRGITIATLEAKSESQTNLVTSGNLALSHGSVIGIEIRMANVDTSANLGGAWLELYV